jgi:hypothetical protein
MVTENYRKANILADLLDFFKLGASSKLAKPGEFDGLIAETSAELAEQERIDGRPADPASERRGFTGAC